MEDYPLVTICLITYERTSVALETIKGIKERIKYPNLSWHIADDGSHEQHRWDLMAEIGTDYGEITVSNTGGHSVGRSMNMGIKECLARSAFWLHWEDDWVPNMEIDLARCVQLMQERKDVGMVRLGRLEVGLYGEVISAGDRLWWLLDKSKHEWCFTGHAALRHRRFRNVYGEYKEGLTPGRTELTMLDQFNKIKDGPKIVWPAWLRYDICDHIGDGYSFKEAMENQELSREEAIQQFKDKGMV